MDVTDNSPYLCSKIKREGFLSERRSDSTHLLLAVYLPALVFAISKGLLIPVMPLYVRSFDVSYGLVGLVLAAESAGTLLSDMPAGVLIRRMGHKRSMLLGAAFSISGALAMFWVDSLVWVVFFSVVCGAGAALWGISRHAYIADLVQVQRRGRSIAVMGGIGRIGAFVGPALGGLVGAEYGLRAPFLVYALLGLLGVVAVLLWVRGDEEGVDESQVVVHVSLWSVFRGHMQPLLTAGSGQLCAQLIRAARHIIIPLYASDILGLDVSSVGLIISVSSAIDMLMFYPAGVIMDRFGRKFAYVPSFTLQAIGMAMIPLTETYLGLQLVALFIGLGNGLGSGTMMTLGADLAPARSRGEFLGIWRFIGDAGSATGPVFIGSIAEVLGLAFAPWGVAFIGLAGAAILAGLVPETLDKSGLKKAPL
ncbi:MAG: MFS family permease [Candidatus Latescibacterota bacterium]